MQRVRSGLAKRVVEIFLAYIKTLDGECPGTPLVDGPDGPMSVCLTGGAAPNAVSKGGCSQSSPCSPCGLCVAPGCSAPGFAAFDTLPPGLRQSGRAAGRFAPATCTDHLRLNGEGRIWYAFW